MAKFLEVKLSAPLSDTQAEALNQADFTSEEWNNLVLEAIYFSIDREAERITVVDTRIIDTDAGFVLPEILP